MPLRERLPYAAFAAASLIWGSTFLVIKLGHDSGVPPLWAATIRLVLASLILFAIAFAFRLSIPRGERLSAALLYGFFQFGLNFGLLYWGELTVPSGVAAVFYATIPLSTLLFAWLLRLERFNAARLGGAVVAFAGVAVIFAGELGQQVAFAGLLAVFIAATCAALSGVLLKQQPQDAIPANAIGAAVGAVVCLVGSLVLGETRALPGSWDAWWPILYLTIAGSLGAFVIWSWLLKTWRASSASMITVIVPVLAFLLGAAVAGERVAPATYVGALLTLAGVFWVLRAPAAPAPPPKAAAE